jgi:hypothetical protein
MGRDARNAQRREQEWLAKESFLGGAANQTADEPQTIDELSLHAGCVCGI